MMMKLWPMIAPLALTACLGPRVKDAPGASAHLLPSDATVPSVADNGELTNQITLNDGLDDRALATAGNVVVRGTGHSAGQVVRYWLFGPATSAPSPIYQFYDAAGAPLPHPALVDALPGDPGYSPLHTINRVVVTDAYRDQRITTVDALTDAIDLGLINVPETTRTFIDSPLVLPGTTIEIGPGATAAPETVYARGYEVGMFRFGGELGIQPANLLPTAQVSFLRAAHAATYDATQPVFQATIPTAPATTALTYTALTQVVDVDLAAGVDPATITDDDQLFVRTPGGAIASTTALVAQFQITSTIEILQLQFAEGSL
jgi:hypothetical protein